VSYTQFLRLSFGLLFVFSFSSSCSQGKDPRLVEDHQTFLIVKGDSIKIDELKLLSINKDTLPSALSGNITKNDINEIIGEFLNAKIYKEIISADLFVETEKDLNVKNIVIEASDVKQIGVFYVEKNQIHYDFYSLQKAGFSKKTYPYLSNAYCDIPFMFFFERYDLKKHNHAMIGFALKKSELPDYDELDTYEIEKDSLYLIANKFFDDYIKK
tara:strand:- start:66124 stop:66765 length:642 start_codon:yes stop_codon:yes gene_type:complete